MPGRAIKTALRTRLGSNGCGPEPHGEPGHSSYFESSFTAETRVRIRRNTIDYQLPKRTSSMVHAREAASMFGGLALGGLGIEPSQPF